MSSLFNSCKAFASDEQGATSIEYALIASIVSIAIAASLSSVKDELSAGFTKAGSELKSNTAAN